MSKEGVVIYHHPNPEMRSFLTSEEISAFRVEHFKRPLTGNSEKALRSLGIIGAQIVKEIMAIQDVMEVWIKPKEIRIRKEESSSWKGVEEKVYQILDRAMRRKGMRLVKT